MNVIDSSAWLEYFAGTARAKIFARHIEHVSTLIVPTITLYEVFKKILRERGEHEALQVVAHMQQGIVVELRADIALLAANLSVEYHLPMADSIILATARYYDAIVWTLDSDFKGIKGVKFFPKK